MSRKTFNRHEDEYVYVDDEYVIFKKYGAVTGTLGAAMNIALLCIRNLKEAKEHVSDEDWGRIIDDLKEELEAQR